METKSYRRFGEMCDACRRARVVGLGYGPPGTGKTKVRQTVCTMELVQTLLTRTLDHLYGTQCDGWPVSLSALYLGFRSLGHLYARVSTVFYTPPVSASVARLEKEVLTVFAAFSYLVEAANQRYQGKEEFLVTRRFSHFIELLIVDEANRLKDAGLNSSVILRTVESLAWCCWGCLAWKSVSRAPQLYSRIGFAHEMDRYPRRKCGFSGEALESSVSSPILMILPIKRRLPRFRITKGNIRLIERLMMQVEHVWWQTNSRWSPKKWSRRHAKISSLDLVDRAPNERCLKIVPLLKHEQSSS